MRTNQLRFSFWLLPILFFATTFSVNGQTKLDAAFHSPKDFDKVYLYQPSEYYRYSWKASRSDEGYPKKTTTHWKGIPAKIDAALSHPTDKNIIYFFAGTKYYRYNWSQDKTEFSKDIASDWPGLPSKVDAALNHPTSGDYVYFFSGNKAYRFNWKSNKVDINKSTSAFWPGISVKVDAALNHPTNTNEVYLFSGTKYYRFNWSANKVDGGYPKDIATHWKGLRTTATGGNGFLVMINGVQCIEAADLGDKIDELYIEVYVDGVYKQKLGPKTMKPAASGIWEQGWESMFDKQSQDLAKWVFAARQEYWMVPGSFYANSSVRFDLWEADLGKGALVDPDDNIGSVTIKRTDNDGNYKQTAFNKGGESGNWRIVCTKLTRTDYSSTSNDRKSNRITIPVKDQGSEGACVGFSATAALGMAYLKKKGLSSTNTDLFDGSALYAKRQGRYKGRYGWNYSDMASGGTGALDYLLKNNISLKGNSNVNVRLKSYYAYYKNGEVYKYTLKNGSVDKQRVESANNNGYNKMRQQIRSGYALMADYSVYNDFGTYVDYSGMYGGRVSTQESTKAGHAVLVYGYDNPRKGDNRFPSWYIQNSWGTKWGIQGKCTFASGAVGIDDVMYRIGDIEIIGNNSSTSSNNLIYGQTYHIKNGYLDYTSGYLDVRGNANCGTNKYGVSLAESKDRYQGTGTWKIVSASGKANGTTVQSGDKIRLINMYQNNSGYLDACGTETCQSKVYDVSTSMTGDRDNVRTSTWVIKTKASGPITQDEVVWLQTQYNNHWLQTCGKNANGNKYGVSLYKNQERAANVTHWKFVKSNAK